ncbi:hypothetical protein Hanom_Chr16g01459651 [Helianthus anomalus]
MVGGILELRLLLCKERVEREGRRQRVVGKGPEREAEGRWIPVTELEWVQVMPVQLQGVGWAGFQSERMPVGSERVDLAWRRSRPSWVNERVVVVDDTSSRDRRRVVMMGGGMLPGDEEKKIWKGVCWLVFIIQRWECVCIMSSTKATTNNLLTYVFSF